MAGLLPPHPMVIYFNCSNVVIVAKCVDEDATWKICRLAVGSDRVSCWKKGFSLFLIFWIFFRAPHRVDFYLH